MLGSIGVAAIAIVTVGTVGIVFCINASFSPNKAVDIPFRIVLAALSFIVLCHTGTATTIGAIVPITAAAFYWFAKCRDKQKHTPATGGK